MHCVIPAGGLSLDHQAWVHTRYPFFLPVNVLSRFLRGKFIEGLKRAHRGGLLRLCGVNATLQQPQRFRSFVRTLFRDDWVVYAKPSLGGATQVLRYLGRYTHRVAIPNQLAAP